MSCKVFMPLALWALWPSRPYNSGCFRHG